MTQTLIQKVTWQTHLAELKAIREIVFINEQQVPLAIEWDDDDATATHLLAYLASDHDFITPIGCARLLKVKQASDAVIGKIGRMAVFKTYRGVGVGNALLKKAIALHREDGVDHIQLSAQCHAIDFYLKAGFKVISAKYQDANIAHVDMRLDTTAF